MENLAKIKIGRLNIIEGYVSDVPLKLKRRLCELGLIKGEKVKVVRKSALGKTYLIEVRGYVLSLRKELVEYLLVSS